MTNQIDPNPMGEAACSRRPDSYSSPCTVTNRSSPQGFSCQTHSTSSPCGSTPTPDEAIGEFQKAVKIGDGSAFALAPLAHAYAIAGKKQETLETLAKLNDIGKHGYVSAFDMAIVYTGMGDKEKAFEWLQKAFEERSFWLIFSRWEPRLDPLKKRPTGALL
jgi:hypothetical protein